MPRRCVFLSPHLSISPDSPRGDAVRIFGNLKMLHDAGVDCRVVKLGLPQYVDTGTEHGIAEPDCPETRAMCPAAHHVALGGRGRSGSTITRVLAAVHDPGTFALGDILHADGLYTVRARIEHEAPDFVWAENVYAASVAHRLRLTVPVIFSHHDWYWRVREFYPEPDGLKQHAIRYCYRRHEARLVREAAGVVGGSRTELATMRALGARCAAYVPTAYPTAHLARPAAPAPARIVHVGALSHWVNRIAMHRFLDAVWPAVARAGSAPPTLQAIGRAADPELQTRLTAAGADCPGIVPRLSDALRPYDIHIIPWEHDTGTRTRATAAMNHGQVVVAVRAGVACLEELESGVNCVLVDSVEAMAPAILDLLHDTGKRQRMGEAARRTFETSFSYPALQPRFEEFLSATVGPDAAIAPAPRATGS